MTPHDHTTYTPGCYRCELGRDEALAAEHDEVRDAERIARALHDAYERLAPAYVVVSTGYGDGNPVVSRMHWALVPLENKKLMIAAVRRLLDDGVISPP